MKQILNDLFDHKKLSRESAKEVLTNITAGKYNHSQIAAFISVYLMRSVSVDELRGFRDALLELCIPVELDHPKFIDLCGTGGDGKSTINISTIASFVVAGAGYKVAKHGNYGVSSICGSSNVLEYLGIRLTSDLDLIQEQFDKANICFLHAPLFHPALKSVGPIRKELGVKTFFNMLGPLVNPAKPKYQLTGVFNLQLARNYQYMFEETHTNYSVIFTFGGYDEISLTDSFKLIDKNGEGIYHPADINQQLISPLEISGGETIEENAKTMVAILKNQGTTIHQKVILTNAAFAIKCLAQEKSFSECYQIAEESLISGNALKTFEKIIQLSNN